MDIKPIDLLDKTFTRRTRGYDRTEVSDFLREVSAELEKVLVENAALRNEIERLQEELKHYHEIEETLNSALVLAQKTADELTQSAKREAELIIREMKDQFERDLMKERAGLEDLRRAKDRFVVEFRSLLKSYLELCEGADSGRREASEQTAGE